MRTFIAVEFPEPLRRELVALRQKLADCLAEAQMDAALRWSSADNYHLTLYFLGETSADQREAMSQGLADLCITLPPISLRLEGIGAFSNWQKMQVLWVGIEGELDRLSRLHSGVETVVTGCGFVPEGRRFHPHVTLARASREAESRLLAQAGALLAAQTALARSLGQWTVSEVVLMRSDPHPGGSVYTPLGRLPLGG
ncbi:MAG: RNA 2',3'-cyclic phosphodiesterase [Caldilineaceae bacterium]|nr:RNA 2',3'-cyclic phosphodiesterase [Caldilineaceae bacterium]HRJ40893.1 RNA 2',3'-cyclic phosphodiesterase [Caldilineaceae bacterium]